jgi:GTPase
VQHLIRKRADDKDFMEIRVAVVGNVDAGKSTLLGKSSLKSHLSGKSTRFGKSTLFGKSSLKSHLSGKSTLSVSPFCGESPHC